MTEQTETKEVMKRDPIYELLSTYKTAIRNVLPKHLTPERILRVAYTAIRRTPKLRECTHDSIINAVLEISMLGLDIGRTAHIVPFGKQATFICDYKGYIDLAHRSGRIEAFTFKPVYEQDDFQYEEGTGRHIKHKPFRGIDRGSLVAAYSIVFFKHGGFDFEVVEAPDIAATKKRSPGAKRGDSPWNQPDLEWTMWCKTAVRRLAKRVPQSPEFQRAAYLEELAEDGLKQDIHHVSKTIDISPVPEGAADLTDLVNGAKAKQDAAPEVPCPYCQKDIQEEIDLERETDSSIFVCSHCNKEGKIEDGKPIGSYPPDHTARNSEEFKDNFVPTSLTTGWRKEWIKLQGPGFATYFHKNRVQFENAPSELKEEARVKWLKLYPDTPWPLDASPDKPIDTNTEEQPSLGEPSPETEEDQKRKELKDKAYDSLSIELDQMPKDVVMKAKKDIGLNKVVDAMSLDGLEALVKRCKELQKDVVENQRVSMMDAIESEYKPEDIIKALNKHGYETMSGCDLESLGVIYDYLLKGEENGQQ